MTNLSTAAAYIVGGTRDNRAPVIFQEAIEETYIALGASAANVEFEELDKKHKITYGKPAEIVEWLLTTLGFESTFASAVSDPFDYGTQQNFDQEEIVTSIGLDNDDVKMKQTGKIYIPDECMEDEWWGTCHVHFAFQGKKGGPLHTNKSQLNHFAAENKIIMVYPQSSAKWDPEGEFDDDDNMIQDSFYPQVVMEMLNRLVDCGELCLDED